MASEKPRDVYIAKPMQFGNGAKLKAYKTHIGVDMVVMTKKEYNKINDKPFNKALKEHDDLIANIDDKALDKQIKMLKSGEKDGKRKS